MDYQIRKLTNDDLELARQFIAQLHIEDGETDLAGPGDPYLTGLLASENFHVIVAVLDGTVAGGLSAYELPMFPKEEKEMFLYDIEVIEPHRRKGVAARLIGALKNICSERGIKTIFVGTSADSGAAIRLYEATGGEREDIPWFTYSL